MTIPPAGYLVDGLMGAPCVLAIADAGSNTSPYIFGDTFMRNFYVTFNYAAKTVSFGVSSNAPPGVTIKSVLGLWEILGIVAGCLIGVILIIFIVRCIQKRRFQKRYQLGGTGDNIVYKDRMINAGEETIDQEPQEGF